MATEFDKFLEEVEQDIRQEKFLKLWQAHKQKIINGTVGVALLIGMYAVWQRYEYHQQGQSSQKFIHAQELIINNKKDIAMDMLADLAKQGYGNYKIQSKLLHAALLSEEGPKQDVEKALQIYEELVNNTKLKPIFRDFALLMTISLRTTRQAVSFEKLLEQLSPLLGEKSPWRPQAMELQAIILFEMGQKDKAAEIFSSIARQADVPEGLMKRAQMMTQVLLQKEKSS